MSPESDKSAPIIIVAAGRSGTKLLRGILASHPEVICFPREINYIWRHGNLRFPSDELRPEHARPEVAVYIRRRFERLAREHNGARVVEKTCANALRVDFVHAVFPEAYVIHLIRDGRAVAESARRRWQASPKLNYLMEKARWVPLEDVPFYAVRYLHYQLGRFGSAERAQASWGPRFSGLDALVAEKTLIEVCGLQWKACVQATEAAVKHLPPAQMITIRYEDLVEAPLVTVQQVFDRVQLSFEPECQAYVARQVRSDHMNKWQEELSTEDMELLMPHIETELLHHGYRL